MELATSWMNSMLDNIVQLIREAETRHAVLQMQVEKLIAEVRGASDGDLRVQAEVGPDSLGVLASFVNHMIRELGTLVITFKTLANEVERATLQTYDDMTQLVESADGQVQRIAMATADVENMAYQSRSVAQRVQSLAQVGIEVYQTTQTGRSAVLRNIEGMERIHKHVDHTVSKVQGLEEHSQEINNIVRTIAGIAHQTNRLALDASIQAALAGEAGKAFRAVAEDIRRAAEVAQTQTTSIERIVGKIGEDIQEVTASVRETEAETRLGTKSSREAGTAFDAIFAAIDRQANEIEMINSAAMRQLVCSIHPSLVLSNL
jgi:methyl-accepting chemotaxis protein